MSHTRWTRATDRFLALCGLPKKQIELEKARRKALCTHKPRPRGVKFTPALERALFRIGVGPEDTAQIAQDIRELASAYRSFESADEEDELMELDKDRVQRKRSENREAYNEYQKNYMRARRAGLKIAPTQISEARSRAAKTRWAAKRALDAN